MGEECTNIRSMEVKRKRDFKKGHNLPGGKSDAQIPWIPRKRSFESPNLAYRVFFEFFIFSPHFFEFFKLKTTSVYKADFKNTENHKELGI